MDKNKKQKIKWINIKEKEFKKLNKEFQKLTEEWLKFCGNNCFKTSHKFIFLKYLFSYFFEAIDVDQGCQELFPFGYHPMSHIAARKFINEMEFLRLIYLEKEIDEIEKDK